MGSANNFVLIIMYRVQLRRLVRWLKRTLRIERQLTEEESNQLFQLSEAILEYGRMIQAYYGHSANVMVEILELARRFRETPQVINDTLCLLRDRGFAEPAEAGCWKLRLAIRNDKGDAA
jgi:hypothetical protein